MRQNVYKSRIIAIFFMLCLSYIAILIHLWFVQIYYHAFYAHKAERQYYIEMEHLPPRACIYDRNKTLLAMNTTQMSAFIMPCYIKHSDILIPFLQTYFPYAYEQLKHNKDKTFLYIKRHLTAAQIACITHAKIPDIHLLQEPCRFYPYPCASPVVGIVNRDNHGISGIELLRDAQLRGTPARYTLEKDGRSQHFYFSKQMQESGSIGQGVQTTLDATLQALISNTLQAYVTQKSAHAGYVLILDPYTGEILVMAQIPFSNPRIQPLDTEYLHNHLVTHAYEFGSIMKVFVALAALEQGVVHLDELINCKQTKTAYIQNRKINTVKEHGIIPFKDVVAFSNNIGIAQVAFRLQEDLYNHYQRLGFGKKTNLIFPGQTSGFINDPSHWSAQSIFSLSYGYEISASILQLGRAFCIIANGGYAIDPTIYSTPHTILTAHKEPLYSPHAITSIKKILVHTTQQGTTKKAAMQGYTIMCKTGTAHMLEHGTYNPDKCLFTCAGIVEKDTYSRVIVACIKDVPEKHVYASTIAVPLFEKIAEQMLIHDKIAR